MTGARASEPAAPARAPTTTAILELKGAFVCEALDLAETHLVWSANHLAAGRYDSALDAFAKMLAAIKAAAAEMVEVRTIAGGEKLTGEVAAEYRASRGIALARRR